MQSRSAAARERRGRRKPSEPYHKFSVCPSVYPRAASSEPRQIDSRNYLRVCISTDTITIYNRRNVIFFNLWNPLCGSTRTLPGFLNWLSLLFSVVDVILSVRFNKMVHRQVHVIHNYQCVRKTIPTNHRSILRLVGRTKVL